jgi:hypothetical protein
MRNESYPSISRQPERDPRRRARRWLTLAATLIGTLGTLAGRAEAASCTLPDQNSVILWEHDFNGACTVVGPGTYNFSQILGMAIGNDRVSSVTLGANVRVTLYEHDLAGRSVTVTSTRTVTPDFNDLTSSFKVEYRQNCPSPGPRQAVVWQDIFSGACDVLEIGDYRFAQVLAMSVGNDQITSVSLGSLVGAVLFENELDGVGGIVNAIRTQSVAFSFNDRTSAVRIYGLPPPPPPPPPTCTRRTCAEAGKTCGSISDGCNGTLNCGMCAGSETCGGGGIANVCGASGPPPNGSLGARITVDAGFSPVSCATGTFQIGPASLTVGGASSLNGQIWTCTYQATANLPAGTYDVTFPSYSACRRSVRLGSGEMRQVVLSPNICN